MTTKYRIKLVVAIPLLAAVGTAASARASEIDELKAQIQSMQKNMEQKQKRITELKQENHKQKQQATAARIGPPSARAVHFMGLSRY